LVEKEKEKSIYNKDLWANMMVRLGRSVIQIEVRLQFEGARPTKKIQ
jgi:hypothetical protein